MRSLMGHHSLQRIGKDRVAGADPGGLHKPFGTCSQEEHTDGRLEITRPMKIHVI